MKQAFYDTKQWPFIAEFEKNWQTILQEYLRVKKYFQTYQDNNCHAGAEVFGFFGFADGRSGGTEYKTNTRFCPATARLIKEHVPMHGAATFSRLAPRTHIQPHAGNEPGLLRMHLGLVIPQGNCSIQVDGHVQSWQAGQALVFDDSFMHEAWNNTDQERVILIMDFRQ